MYRNLDVKIRVRQNQYLPDVVYAPQPITTEEDEINAHEKYQEAIPEFIKKYGLKS